MFFTRPERNRIRNRALLAIAITLATLLVGSGFPLPYYTITGTVAIPPFDLGNFPFSINFPYLIIDIIIWYVIITILTVTLQILTRRI